MSRLASCRYGWLPSETLMQNTFQIVKDAPRLLQAMIECAGAPETPHLALRARSVAHSVG